MAVEFAAVDEEPGPQPRNQRARRGQLEQLGRLVEGRLADQRLVAVIKAIELRPEQEHGQAGHGDPCQLQRARGEPDRQYECGDDRDDVRRQKRATKERIAAHACRWATSLGDAKRRRPASADVRSEATRAGQRGAPRSIRLGSSPCLHTHPGPRLLARLHRFPVALTTADPHFGWLNPSSPVEPADLSDRAPSSTEAAQEVNPTGPRLKVKAPLLYPS